MKTRTIAGDIRRIRSLMRLGPDVGSCVIRREDYGELLKLFDAIETKAKRMQNALKPVMEIVMDRATSDLSMEMAIMESRRIYNGGAK